jgi:DMSO reductase anchor subunit
MTMTPATVEVIPAVPQRVWRVPAVLNFALGGVGAGFYAIAVLASAFGASPTVELAAWLGPALVFAGFGAVAVEAGRPLRGPRVLARVRSSWMSRELLLGGAFAVLALSEWIAPGPLPRALAMLAALALAAAQGFLLRSAKAIGAWDVPIMPVVFVVAALVSGTGLLLAVMPALGEAPSPGLLTGALAVIVLGAVTWLVYVTWSAAPSFARPTEPLRMQPGVALGFVGYLLPAIVLALAVALPPLAFPAAVIAGALLIAGQLWTKWLLIRTVATLRPITLVGLNLTRRIS